MLAGLVATFDAFCEAFGLTNAFGSGLETAILGEDMAYFFTFVASYFFTVLEAALRTGFLVAGFLICFVFRGKAAGLVIAFLTWFALFGKAVFFVAKTFIAFGIAAEEAGTFLTLAGDFEAIILVGVATTFGSYNLIGSL